MAAYSIILCTVKTGVLPLHLKIQWQQTLNRGVEITTATLKLGNTRLYSHWNVSALQGRTATQVTFLSILSLLSFQIVYKLPTATASFILESNSQDFLNWASRTIY